MRVRFLSPFNYVIHRNKSGTPLQTASYSASDEPITVKRDHGEAAVLAGKAVEVDEPATVDDAREKIVRAMKSKSKPSEMAAGVIHEPGTDG